MPATTVKSARKNLKDLIREVNGDTVAVEIVGDEGNAVLISLARYTALREATFLLRSPELMDSLRREAARSLLEVPAEDEPAAAPRTKTENTKNAKNARKRKKSSRKKRRRR
ncbi:MULTISPECIES: type II toxin-antitoxin system Phd/YefM family antitoxin [Rhodococcus]|uniref:type II toxin-antitoxin system Phd/YefM family antitoxin n=1 Tax=Rhodococcus TaxID=1827 RepID=UPI001CF8C7AC|nr:MULTISPECIES: prevent-host-death family protein [Rhodococcus]